MPVHQTAVGVGDRLLPWRDVRARVGDLSRATVWNLRRLGQFPQPVRVSRGRVAWRESDIDAWVASRTSVAVNANEEVVA